MTTTAEGRQSLAARVFLGAVVIAGILAACSIVYVGWIFVQMARLL